MKAQSPSSVSERPCNLSVTENHILFEGRHDYRAETWLMPSPINTMG